MCTVDSNSQSKKSPEKSGERPPKETDGTPMRGTRHDKPVEFPVSDSAVSQADGEP